MKIPPRYLALLLCGGLLGATPSAPASGLSDLIDAAGRGLPDVPEPPEPTRVDDPDTDSPTQDPPEEESAHEEELRLQQAEQERLAQEAQARREKEEAERRAKAEQERVAREEQARREAQLQREREEKARQERLRQQAAAARVQWASEDEKNDAAFDDILSIPGGADAAGGDPNVVDLSDSTHLVPALLGGGPPRVSLRIKPPPLPTPEFTLPATGSERELPEPPPRWHPDWEGKFKDLGFAYASMYLKDKIDGLASIPELVKDSLDLKKKLNEHCNEYLGSLFSTASQAANPRANYAILADQAEERFQGFAAAVDEDARSGIRNNLATTSSGALPEGSDVAEVGIGMGQSQLQDVQELKKWSEANKPRQR